MAQMKRTHARMCHFLASVDIAAHLGDRIAQKPKFWSVNGHFQPNAPNIEMFIL